MRKAVAYLAVSLDGYIADADGGVGWLGAFADEQEDRGCLTRAVLRAGWRPGCMRKSKRLAGGSGCAAARR